jgi:hypothetical protein
MEQSSWCPINFVDGWNAGIARLPLWIDLFL